MPKKRIPMNSCDMKDIIYPNAVTHILHNTKTNIYNPKNAYESLYP